MRRYLQRRCFERLDVACGAKIDGFRWFGHTPVNWTSFRAAGFRDQQKPLMLLHLKIEPEKSAPFQFLPEKSAQAVKVRRLTWFHCHRKLSSSLPCAQTASTHQFSEAVRHLWGSFYLENIWWYRWRYFYEWCREYFQSLCATDIWEFFCGEIFAAVKRRLNSY